MIIKLTKSTGIGPTKLSAFDQALVNAGIANFNLIYLSSVLPLNSTINKSNTFTIPSGTWGDRLYVVMAQKRVSQHNQEAWAGIGWIQDPKTKKGLLVEHEGHSESEVKADINNSLVALAKNRKMKFSKTGMIVSGVVCKDQPVCALVAAVFESSKWESV